MKRIVLGLFALCFFWTSLYAQHISNVIEYVPAPGQYINTSPWGNPSSALTIIGDVNGTLNLGAFGGYVVFEFSHAVENHPNNPYGIDFTIFGNPLNDFSEAAIVYVMKDENENGLADDTWYELAGSDYYFDSSVHNYEVNYFNPNEGGADIPWSDNYGNSDVITANAFHTQNYYPNTDSFPMVTPENYILAGSFIKGHIDKSNASNIKSYKRGFGYADNNARGVSPWTIPDNPYTEETENAGGDAFDISWAINAEGGYVDLDEIHFIKVQNAMQDMAGWLGEISTEITGACIVTPDNSISGETKFVHFKTLPDTIRSNNFQLHPFCYEMGRLNTSLEYEWTLNSADATIDNNDILHIENDGVLTISISLRNHPEISYSQEVIVNGLNSIWTLQESNIRLFPSPAQDFIQLSGLSHAEYEIFDISGQQHIAGEYENTNSKIDVTNLKTGMYIIRLIKDGQTQNIRFIISK